MTQALRLWPLVSMFAVSIGLAHTFAHQPNPLEKDVKDIADEIKKCNDAEAKKMAGAAAKKIAVLPDLMHLFKPRNKDGMGWGSKEGRNPALDGLEKRIQEYAKKVSATDAADPSNEEAGYWIAALADLTLAKGPPAKKVAGGAKAWAEYSVQMREASVAFAKASATKKAADIKKAAEKLNSICGSCHVKFK